MNIDAAWVEKFRAGRESYGGDTWVGDRGVVEAKEEILDAYAYVNLEKVCLLKGADEHSEKLSLLGSERVCLDVANKILHDLAEVRKGLGLLSSMLKGKPFDPHKHLRGW